MALNELYNAGMLNPTGSVSQASGSSSVTNTPSAILSQHNLLAHNASMHNAALLAAANSTTVISSSASAMFLHSSHHNTNARNASDHSTGSNSNPLSSLGGPNSLIHHHHHHGSHSATASGGGGGGGENASSNTNSNLVNLSNPALSANSIVSASTTTTIMNSNAAQPSGQTSSTGASNSSAAAALAAAANARSERKPLCARCRNHNVMIQVKGHKRYCDFRDCECEKCLLTQERRVIMAKQVALSRHQSEDLMAGRIGQSSRMPIIKRISSEFKDSPGYNHGGSNKKQRQSSASNSPSSAASSYLNVNNDSLGFNPISNSNLSDNGISSPRAQLSVGSLTNATGAVGLSTSGLDNHLSTMNLGNANQNLGLNLNLLGINPNLYGLNAASLAALSSMQSTTSGSNQITSQSQQSNSSTRSTSRNQTSNSNQIIVDDEDDEPDDQNSYTSESAEALLLDQQQRQTTSASKNLRLSNASNNTSNRLSTGSTGSSASSIQSLSQQTTPPSLSLLEHSLINSHQAAAAHLPHSLHPHHPLSQSALLNFHQQSTTLPSHTNSDSITNSINSCATSSSNSANTLVSQSAGSHHSATLHPHNPYNLNSFPNLGVLNSLNNFPYGPLAAAHQHITGNAGGQSQSTIHHHPLFATAAAASSHQPNFSAIMAEQSSNLGLQLPRDNGSTSSSSVHSSRRSSDTALQLDLLANSSKNFLSAAGLTSANSINNNSSVHQRTQQHIQQLQHKLHQNHQQQQQIQRLNHVRAQSHDSDISDSEEAFESASELGQQLSQLRQRSQMTLAHLNQLNHLKNKEKSAFVSKHSESNNDQLSNKKKDKRDLELQTNNNNKASKQQNGHCHNNKLDHHDERDEDKDDDYSGYNKKKIFILAPSKKRRHYQSSSSSSNNTNSSTGNNNENVRKQSAFFQDEEDFENQFDESCESANGLTIIDLGTGYEEDEDEEDDDEEDIEEEYVGEDHTEKMNAQNDNTFFNNKNRTTTEMFESISSAAEKEINKNEQNQVAKQQQQTTSTQNKLNLSTNSSYSTGSVMSLCGTATTDVNSTTNDNEDKERDQAKRRESYFEENDENLDDIRDDADFFEQDAVLQKQADSTISIVDQNLNGSSTSVFVESETERNNAEENAKVMSKNLSIKKLMKKACGLSDHLSKPTNQHLTDCLVLAFLKDNHGRVDSCIDKLNGVYNEMRAQKIDRNDLCDQFFVKNQTVVSKHYRNCHNRPNEPIGRHSFFDKQLSKDSSMKPRIPDPSCNENNKNESNIITLSLSSSSSNSDQEYKELQSAIGKSQKCKITHDLLKKHFSKL